VLPGSIKDEGTRLTMKVPLASQSGVTASAWLSVHEGMRLDR
jgi:hypothetical protein